MQENNYNYQQNDRNTDTKTLESIPFWEQFMYAFRSSKYYNRLAEQKTGSIIKYFCLLSLLLVLLTVVVPITGFLIGVGGINTYIENKIPAFSFRNGELSMDGTIEYETDMIKLYGDSSVSEYTKKDIDKSSYVQILISKSNMLVYSGGYLVNYPFKDFSTVIFDKDLLLSLVPFMYVMLVFYAVMSFLFKVLGMLFMDLMFALMGLFSNYVYQSQLRFSKLFILAVYATTIVQVLESLNGVLHIFSSTLVSIVGIMWSAFYFFQAIARNSQIIKNMQL